MPLRENFLGFMQLGKMLMLTSNETTKIGGTSVRSLKERICKMCFWFVSEARGVARLLNYEFSRTFPGSSCMDASL